MAALNFSYCIARIEDYANGVANPAVNHGLAMQPDEFSGFCIHGRGLVLARPAAIEVFSRADDAVGYGAPQYRL
jgi:hypothetical protein